MRNFGKRPLVFLSFRVRVPGLDGAATGLGLLELCNRSLVTLRFLSGEVLSADMEIPCIVWHFVGERR